MPPNHFQRAAEAMARAYEQEARGLIPDTCPPPWTSYAAWRRYEQQSATLRALIAILPEIGWKLVPVKATREMLKVADEADDQSFIRNLGLPASAEEHWDEMLAAAPSFDAESGHGG